MLNFNYPEKSLGLVSPPHFMNDVSRYFSCYILLPDQISLSDSLYIPRYLVIWVLQLLVNQAVTS